MQLCAAAQNCDIDMIPLCSLWALWPKRELALEEVLANTCCGMHECCCSLAARGA